MKKGYSRTVGLLWGCSLLGLGHTFVTPSQRIRFHPLSNLQTAQLEMGELFTENNHPQLIEFHVNADEVLLKSTSREIDELVQSRAEARWSGNYEAADELRKRIDGVALPPYCEIELEDIARADGGGSKWKLLYKYHVKEPKETAERKRGVLNLAHAALGMAVSNAELKRGMDSTLLNNLVGCALDQLEQWSKVHTQLCSANSTHPSIVLFARLESLDPDVLTGWRTVEFELRGRKASDAAFWFALAGVTNGRLFELLTAVSVKEIGRFGRRSSCRAKDILAVIERLAAAGVRNNSALEALCHDCLESKDVLQSAGGRKTRKLLLNLHSDHCALMIWKFSTKQRKQKSFLLAAAQHWEQQQTPQSGTTTRQIPVLQSNLQLPCWKDEFEDPSLPLIVDVGCGMGLSLLGLASLESQNRHNFVGVDLSPVAIGYGSSIAQRWDLEGRLLFVVAEAQLLLEHIRETYTGPVELILMQFPTPYRLPTATDTSGRKERGNSQLPTSAFDGFMVTPDLLRVAGNLLHKNLTKESHLIIQSNCEDVAVAMKTLACQFAGFYAMEQDKPVEEPSGFPTRRTLDWVGMGGERAVGNAWSAVPLLPPTGRTETEIACVLNGTPVHRCSLTLHAEPV